MTLLDDVRNTLDIYQMVEPGDTVLVGVSGGPDSVALLHALSVLSDDYGVTLHVAHLNHLMRGKEAEADAEYVRSLALSLHLETTVWESDIRALAKKWGMSEEEAGRKERYRMYKEVAMSVNASRVALGHNRDDQVETVLMRVLRGTGVEGLAGIPPVRGLAEGITLIRPLIGVSRDDIEEYCRVEGLATRLDRTNLEPIYLRNRLRHYLIPLLEKEYNPEIRESLARIAEICREDSVYLREQALEALRHATVERKDGLRISTQALAQMAPALRRRVLRAALREVRGSLQGIGFVHIADLERLALGCTGKSLDLPGEVWAWVDYETLSLSKQPKGTKDSFPCTQICVPGDTHVPGLSYTFNTYIADSEEVSLTMQRDWSQKVAFRSYFDYNKVVLPLYIRPRLPGDTFRPLGLGGSKKVKDFLISKKVPRSQRGRVPLLISGNEIAWVVGMRQDDRFKVTPDTKRVLVITVNSSKRSSPREGGETGEQGIS